MDILGTNTVYYIYTHIYTSTFMERYIYMRMYIFLSDNHIYDKELACMIMEADEF